MSWIGKIKVYIQHLPGIPNPNNVSTPTALISVRGTVFSVDVQDAGGHHDGRGGRRHVDVRNLLCIGYRQADSRRSHQVIRMRRWSAGGNKGVIFKRA